MIIGMAFVKPRLMIFHEPLWIALAMAPHVLRCSLIIWLPGWCDIIFAMPFMYRTCPMYVASPQCLFHQTFTHHHLAQFRTCCCCNAQVSEVPGNAGQLMLSRNYGTFLSRDFVGLRQHGKLGAFQQHLVPRSHGWRRVHADFAADNAGALIAWFTSAVVQRPVSPCMLFSRCSTTLACPAGSLPQIRGYPLLGVSAVHCVAATARRCIGACCPTVDRSRLRAVRCHIACHAGSGCALGDQPPDNAQ